ncbi:hypothetical protein L6R52_24900, partial [Myxococcota bacterium]|nr:hypothetical protein [Myxococcota bacterium]
LLVQVGAKELGLLLDGSVLARLLAHATPRPPLPGGSGSRDPAGAAHIDKVTSSGTDREMSNGVRGEITQVNQPNNIQYSYNTEGRMYASNDNFLGTVVHSMAGYFGDRFRKTATCNSRQTYYYYAPTGPGGASPQLDVLDTYQSCVSNYPRHLRFFVYLEGRPLAVLHARRTSSANEVLTEDGTFWIHTDHLGTPILISDTNHIERWRWENDPFGLADPVEYTVASADVNPDDTSGNPYNTCCCAGCAAGCGQCTTGCNAGQCSADASQAVVWTRTYAPNPGSGRTVKSVRVHFSTFDVEPGTSRTEKDYVRLFKSDGTTEVATYTGNLGSFWSAWSGDSALVIKLVADNFADASAGVVIDALEYTSDTSSGTSEQFVFVERFPGQIWDDDARAAYNYQRWYRREDGRYTQPDPIGLAGGEAGYFGYVAANPLKSTDPTGLLRPGGFGPHAPVPYSAVTDAANFSIASSASIGSRIATHIATTPRQLQPVEPIFNCQYVEYPFGEPHTFECASFPATFLPGNPECDALLGNAGGDPPEAGCKDGKFTCRVCNCPYLRDEGFSCDRLGNGTAAPTTCPPGYEPRHSYRCSAQLDCFTVWEIRDSGGIDFGQTACP